MYSSDKSGFKNILLSFYKQIQESEPIFKQTQINLVKERIQNILYLGMGGSAIAGDLLYDVLFDDLHVPLDVVRGYIPPGYCNARTLVLVSSYSGNTEETLSSMEKVRRSGAQIVAITSGGKLAHIAAEEGWPILSLPQGLPPRQSLGYLFFPIYHLLGHLQLIDHYQKDLHSLTKFIKDKSKRNEYPHGGGKILSLNLAHTIQNKIPVFYSTAPYLRTVSRRWQNQMHENAKSLAFANVLPEMNHNEIVGWELESEWLKGLIAIFLENEDPHPRIKKRIELSQKIIKNRGVQVVKIYSSGKTRLEKVFSLIVLGDWVSYYLAMSYKKDPIQIANIDYLKGELAKFKG